MTGFIVRVELHGDRADYDELHKWMQTEGFSLAIAGEKKKPFKLPSGTYDGQSNREVDELRDHLRDTMPWCGSTERPSILVVAYSQIAWSLKSMV